jgi:hypothetical protein
MHDQTIWGIDQDERLGSAIAIGGDRVVVSGGLASGLLGSVLPSAGHVVVFDRQGSSWLRTARGTSPEPGQRQFGAHIGLAGAKVLASVAEPFAVDGKQAARVVALDVSGGSLGNAQYVALPARPFGYGAFAASGLHLLVHDSSPAEGLAHDQGRVLAFDLQVGTSFASVITNGAPSATLGFGTGVAANADELFIGAPWFIRNLTNLPGRVHVYLRNGQRFEPSHVLMSPGETAFDEFGTSISADETFVVVGAPASARDGTTPAAGAVFVYTRSDPSLMPTRLAPASDEARFGQSVGVRRGTLLVGAPYERSGDTERAGSVYRYIRAGGTWMLADRIEEPLPRASGNFGSNIIWIGDSLAAIASVPDAGNGRCGRVHILRLSPSGSETVQTLAASTPCIQPFGGDEYGRHLAWTGEHLVVLSTEPGPAAGLYLYRLVGDSFELVAERPPTERPLDAIGTGNGFLHASTRDGNSSLLLIRYAIVGETLTRLGGSLPVSSLPRSTPNLLGTAFGLVATVPAERADDTSGGAAYILADGDLQTNFVDGFEAPIAGE